MAKKMTSREKDNTGLEVIGGVAAGAAVGSLLGPLGAAVGAVVGGAVGPKVAEADYSKPTAKVKAAAKPVVRAAKKQLSGALKSVSQKVGLGKSATHKRNPTRAVKGKATRSKRSMAKAR